jgi:ElaB/YqjD/DUF883 family membrane-anchored ribosome-binding protein
MPDPKKSPAVQSMKIEQASQRERASKDDLETGLEDTFPASDPVSATHSSISGGRMDMDEAARISRKTAEDDGFRLVDEALQSTGEGRQTSERAGGGRTRVRALRRDAAHIAETASEVVSGTKSLAKAQVRSVFRDVEDRIREQPIAAVAVVAVLAFMFGARR